MRKGYWIALTGVLLVATCCAPAMATTGITVDGKTYVVYGDQATFVADGKTFTIYEDSVLIQEDGKPDRIFPLTASSDRSAVLTEETSAACASETVSENASVLPGSEATASACVEASNDTSLTEASVSVETTALSSGTYDFSQYAQYGLSYDAAENILYYQDQRVRVFEDSYPLGEDVCSAVSHFDALGTVDVETVRDLTKLDRKENGSYDPSGKLTRLRALSGTEFAARDLTEWTRPQASATYATSGVPMTEEEAKAFYAPYAQFGLTYDSKTGSLVYQGQVARRFLDVRKSNGEALGSGKFSGTMTNLWNDAGTVDVTTIRDYANPDAEGNGRLTGMSVEKAE